MPLSYESYLCYQPLHADHKPVGCFASPGAPNKRVVANMCSPKELIISLRPSKYPRKLGVKVYTNLKKTLKTTDCVF